MAIHVNDIRTFFRLVYGNIISEMELAHYLPHLETHGLTRIIENKEENIEIRRLALKGLTGRTKEPAVLQSFFKVTNSTNLIVFEQEVLHILVARMDDAKTWQLKSDSVQIHSQQSVRLRLAKIMASKDHFNEAGNELIKYMIKHETDPDVRRAAALAVLKRPGFEMNQILFDLVGSKTKELDEIARKALLERSHYRMEYELCDALAKELAKSEGKNTKKLRALRSVTFQRIKRLNYAKVLGVLTEDAIPEIKLRERVCQIFWQKLQDPKIDPLDLFGLFGSNKKHPRERNMIFEVILGRDGFNVVNFLKVVAAEGLPEEDFWLRAIADLDRRGEGNKFKMEILCETPD